MNVKLNRIKQREKKMRVRDGFNRLLSVINSPLKEPVLRSNLTSKGYLVIDLNTKEGIDSMPRNWKRGYSEAPLDFFVDGTDINPDENSIYPLSHEVKLFFYNNGFVKLSENYIRFLNKENHLKINIQENSIEEELIDFLNTKDKYALPVVSQNSESIETLEFKLSNFPNNGMNESIDKKYNELVLNKNEKDYHIIIAEDIYLKNRQRIIGYEI